MTITAGDYTLNKFGFSSLRRPISYFHVATGFSSLDNCSCIVLLRHILVAMRRPISYFHVATGFSSSAFLKGNPVTVGRLLAMFALFCSGVAAAQDNFDIRFETKVHYRNSEENRFPVSFPFPPQALPEGAQTAFLETVDAGDKVDLSTITAAGRWSWNEKLAVHFKVDVWDKYDRNPTSEDNKIDLDVFFIRYGEHFRATRVPLTPSFYAQIGKFAKFERQRERRTESYGLVSTAFNRFEDAGIELGFQLPIGLYGKASWTTGNPVFIRDPNALAGDNGTSDIRVPPNVNPDPELKTGIPILYDAEIESFDLGEDSEVGLGVGYRWRSEDNNTAFDILLFGYERTLAQDRGFHGSFYGSDLDLFDLGEVAGATGIRLPAEGDKKEELGANLWLNVGSFSLFAQAVDQEAANLGRVGKEVELSYTFDWGLTISPVIRYSELDPDFVGNPAYPAPSVWWQWEKYDYGVNIDLSDSLRVIIEYADNTFIRAGREEENNETLVSFIWRHR